MRKPLLSLLGAGVLLGCGPRRVEAQFIGYTAPQTVQQTLATNATCTGVAQNFPVNNLGQISHSAQITTLVGVVTLQLSIQGSTDGSTFVNISDVATATSLTVLGVTTQGYAPVVRVQVLCTPGTGTFTLTYSGVAATQGFTGGVFFTSQVDKQLTQSASAGTTASFPVGRQSTPFGNSAGTLIFQYATSGPAGSSLTVTCQSSTPSINLLVFGPYSLASGATTQVFQIPPAPCAFYQVTYTAGGASANLISSIDYVFTAPGTPNSQSMLYSPLLLGVNALTEPGAGTSALSNIIDTRGAKQAVLKFSCTAGAITVNVQTYQEDGATTSTLISPLSAVAAATLTDLTISSESNPSSSSGTISTTALVRFPQRAVAFSFTNAGGAGTCTARLFLGY